MEELKLWMEAEFEEKRIEPNSGMGNAINYMLKRWNKFTLFLRRPGAPLHNNIVERTLKGASGTATTRSSIEVNAAPTSATSTCR